MAPCRRRSTPEGRLASTLEGDLAPTQRASVTELAGWHKPHCGGILRMRPNRCSTVSSEAELGDLAHVRIRIVKGRAERRLGIARLDLANGSYDRIAHIGI
jgi:hypothetical protein